jgi:hypothetical protein
MSGLYRWAAARRKFFVAALTPLLLPAAHYLGGVAISHVWYAVVIGEAGALGVHAVANATTASMGGS